MTIRINDKLSSYTAKLLSWYLKFPENEPITAVDFRADDGTFLKKITDAHQGEKYLFGVVQESYNVDEALKNGFYKVSNAPYKSEGRLSKNAFSLAIVDPLINPALKDELLNTVDAFVEPDFEKMVREKFEHQHENDDQIDFSLEGLTEEEKEKQEELAQKRLEKAIKEARLAYRRMLREQERRLSLMRDDKFLLSRVTERLMPGGILIMITPKELIDQTITIKLCNLYEDIKILRLDDDEYFDYRKCIILAKKRHKALNDRDQGVLLAETKLTPYKELEVIKPQIEPSYEVPAQSLEAVSEFRIGPLTAEEIAVIRRRSNLIDHFAEQYNSSFLESQPVTPTPLHKGHIMLLLTSGHLNGYIGKGPDQHLVKGMAIKLSREEVEGNDQGEQIIKEREYFHLGVKYLDRTGKFHRLI